MDSQVMFAGKRLNPAPISIEGLLDQCCQDIARYQLSGGDEHESSCCAELVRLAATGNESALSALLELSDPLVRRKCDAQLAGEIDDVVQEVALRLVRKFTHPQSPYQPGTFAAYVSYLNLTVRSVTLNMLQRQRTPDSLDQMREGFGREPAHASHADQVEQRMLLQKLLALLPDPLEREALRRRYTLLETPEEIAEALQEKAPEITKEKVYRLVERGLRRLVNHEVVQQIRGELA